MDFYVILGVDRTASAIDVKRAYRRLARKHHPDINPGDQEAEAFFRRVSEAYETLIDPERRQDYDVHGQMRTSPEGAADPLVEFEGFDFSMSSTGESASTFGDLFADVFANSAGDRAQETGTRGVDLHTALRLDFQDAMRGGTHEVTVTRVARCDACRGSGRRRVAESRCVSCAGTGQARWTRGHMVFSRRCRQCGGTGRRRHRPCGVCRTEGVVSRTETVAFRMEAGVADGARIRVPGQGSTGGAVARPAISTLPLPSTHTRSSGAREATCISLCRSQCTRRPSAHAWRCRPSKGRPRFGSCRARSPVSGSGCGVAGRRHHEAASPGI